MNIQVIPEKLGYKMKTKINQTNITTEVGLQNTKCQHFGLSSRASSVSQFLNIFVEMMSKRQASEWALPTLAVNLHFQHAC